MNLAKLELRLKQHAYHQYVKRVGPIKYEALKEQCKELLNDQNYRCTTNNRAKYLHLGEIWWIYKVRNGQLSLITCYGQHHFDMVEAQAWARKHNDRIKLSM